MLIVLALIIATGGFAAIRGASGLARRATGWMALFAAAAPCIAHWGWSVGAAMWVGILSVAALALVFAPPYAPGASARER